MTLDVDALEESIAEAGLAGDDADAVAAGAYGAAELAWSLEELTQKEPNAKRLAAAVRLLRAAAPGSESHVATALQLNEITAARVGALLRAQRGRPGARRGAAAEKRLLAKVMAGNEDAEGALVAYYEAMYFRCVLCEGAGGGSIGVFALPCCCLIVLVRPAQPSISCTLTTWRCPQVNLLDHASSCRLFICDNALNFTCHSTLQVRLHPAGGAPCPSSRTRCSCSIITD